MRWSTHGYRYKIKIQLVDHCSNIYRNLYGRILIPYDIEIPLSFTLMEYEWDALHQLLLARRANSGTILGKIGNKRFSFIWKY